jgi:hypothetical protein
MKTFMTVRNAAVLAAAAFWLSACEPSGAPASSIDEQPKYMNVRSLHPLQTILPAEAWNRTGSYGAWSQYRPITKSGDPVAPAAFLTPDEDEDGVDDLVDAFPFDPLKTQYPVLTENEPNDEIGNATSIDWGEIPLKISGEFSGPNDIEMIELPPNTEFAGYTLVFEGVDDLKLGITRYDLNGEIVETKNYVDDQLMRGGFHPSAIHNVLRTTALYSDQETIVKIEILEVGLDGAFPMPYTIRVFAEKDLDGIPDDIEDAIGSASYKPDSDGDTILDGDESFSSSNVMHSELDSDDDGTPNYLDADSDGDGIPDANEGTLDADNDGQPNFIDPDSDGNGIEDSIEAIELMDPIDSDGDKVPDYIDLDDDNDRITDSFDADRLTGVFYQDSEEYPLIGSADTALEDGTTIRDAVIPEGKVVVGGVGFSTGEEILVSLFSRKPNDNATWTTDGTFVDTFTVAFYAPQNLQRYNAMVVTIGGRPSNEMMINVRSGDVPTIISAPAIYVVAGGYATLTARNVTPDTTARLNNIEIASTFISSTKIRVTIPANAQRGSLYISNPKGSSNRVSIVPTHAIASQVYLPDGDTTAYNQLYVDAGNAAEVPLSVWLNAWAVGPSDRCLPIRVIRQTDGVSSEYLSAFPDASNWRTDINTLTTAAVMSLSPFAEMSIFPYSLLCAVLPEVYSDPAVQALAASLDRELLFTGSIDDALPLISEEAEAAVNHCFSIIQNYLANNPDGDSQFAKSMGPEYSPLIFPVRDHGLSAIPQRVDGIVNGNISVLNDTMMLGSAKMIGEQSGRLLMGHVTGPFDPSIIPSQNNFSIVDAYTEGVSPKYEHPNFEDAIVSVVTSGLASTGATGLDSNESVVHGWLLRRAIVRSIVAPIISESAGLPAGSLRGLEATMYHLDAAVQATSLAQSGDISGAFHQVFSSLKNDLLSYGPITTMLVKNFGLSPEIVLRKFGIQLTVRMAPYLGWAWAAATNAPVLSDVGNSLYDFENVPKKIDFSVDWPLQFDNVVALDPRVPVTAANPGRVSTLGAGFSTYRDEYDELVIPQIEYSLDTPSPAHTLQADGAVEGGFFPVSPNLVVVDLDVDPLAWNASLSHADVGRSLFVRVRQGDEVTPYREYTLNCVRLRCTDQFFGVATEYMCGFEGDEPLWGVKVEVSAEQLSRLYCASIQ